MQRDYYYEVNDRGVLTLDGLVQNDPAFLDFFFRRLAITANPHYPDHPYVSRCGDEMNYLKPADTPIVFTGFDGERLLYAYSLSVPMFPDRLRYSEDGILYHWAPVGGVGRIVPAVATEISRHIEHWGPYYAFRDTEHNSLTPFIPILSEDFLTVLRPRADSACIGCGAGNDNSFRLSFIHDKQANAVVTYIKPDARMQGSFGIVHGGMISLLLDETMGKCLSAGGIKAPTARISVNYRKPMMLGVEYEIRGWVDRQQGRKNFMRAAICSWDTRADVIADAEALFIALKGG
ncbi:MAG: DUF4505 family protein [Ignavibacteria bacterium]|nr:DUF4505 family protein [Ignavibacteria bacterium]